MKNSRILLYLKIATFLVFIGRAYQHLFWDAPFRALFWDQNLMEKPVNWFLGKSWNDYATNLNVDKFIQSLIFFDGVFYLLCAILTIFITFSSKKIIKTIIFIGGLNLIFLSILLTKDKFYHLAMFFEHAIQFSSPLLLLFFIKTKNKKALVLRLKIAIALTFTCHGLYALGTIYPLPANFVTMTMNISNASESLAKEFLVMAAILDFIISIGIFIPKIGKICLLYAFIWGTATALARIVSALEYGFTLKILHQYFFQTVYRIPHGIIPLLVFLMLEKTNVLTSPLHSTQIHK